MFMQKNADRALPVILLAIFLDLTTNGILVPVVPQLLANPDSAFYLLPHGVPISYAYIILGLLIGVLPIFLFFSTPILGSFSDKVGRKKVMALALLGSGASLALFAGGVMMRNLTVLFIARILGGIMSGNVSVAQAAIADITPPSKRVARFGLVGAAYGVGFILGPVIGGLLSDRNLISWFSASTPFWFAAGLAFVNALMVWIFMVETENLNFLSISAQLKILTGSVGDGIRDVISAYNMKNIRAIFATNFLFQGGLALFATFFAVFLTASFGFNQTNVGYYIGFAGVWVIISQGFLLRWLSRYFDEVSLLRVFLFLGAASVFLYYITQDTFGLLVVGACFALTNGINMAALPSLASRRAPDAIQGEILGVTTSVQSLAQAIPPVLAGFLAAEITPSAPIYIAGAVIGAAWLVFMFTVKK